MRLALVCGDGLPVSGLLTVFRNVVQLGTGMGVLDLPVTADLGYSWRPDKPAFYPRGHAGLSYPQWLRVRDDTPADGPGLAGRLTAIRQAVADGRPADPARRAALDAEIGELAAPYEEYFARWFADEDVDWVCAINMTLSDAVPVTLGLHRAAARRWDGSRPGGVLFWDHDLFGSYAVRERGVRVYPEAPTSLTPVPGTHPSHRWAVVSDELAKEASGYPSPLVPAVVPNPLPAVEPAGLADRHHEFLARHEIDGGRPVVLVPVRVFRVKGVEISLALLAAVGRVCAERGEPRPCLLVFGSMDEDPEYAAEVRDTVEREGVAGDVRFLDGVPLGSHQDPGGAWLLDEVDLLRIAAATGGGVFFTPNCPDVESVGLGPALAAIAGVPCAVTSFAALHTTYGDGHRYAMVDWPGGLDAAAEDFAGLMAGRRRGDPEVLAALRRNREQVLHRFPAGPWRDLLRELADTTA